MLKTRSKYFFLVLFVVGSLSQVHSGHAAARQSRGLLSLPERVVYKTISIPGTAAKRVFPRTTASVERGAKGAQRSAGRVVRGAATMGKKTIETTRNVVVGTVNYVGRTAAVIGGTFVRAASGK